MPPEPTAGVPQAEVGQVVQDYIDNGEVLVEARKDAEDSYTVTALDAPRTTRSRRSTAGMGMRSASRGDSGGRGEANPKTPKRRKTPKKRGKFRKRKPN